MFLEVDPGHGRVLPEGGRIGVEGTPPDVDPDEIFAALDADTRPYLTLLVSGAGKGLRGRGDDLNAVLRRLEPLHRDLARVTRATARRRHALRRLVHSYSLLTAELGRHPERAAAPRERVGRGVRRAGRRGAGHLHGHGAAAGGAASSPRGRSSEVGGFARELKPTLAALRPPIRRLEATNAAVRPFLRETTSILRDQIRPFVRAARPWTADLRVATVNGAKAAPDLTDSLTGAQPLLQHRRLQPRRARRACPG